MASDITSRIILARHAIRLYKSYLDYFSLNTNFINTFQSPGTYNGLYPRKPDCVLIELTGHPSQLLFTVFV